LKQKDHRDGCPDHLGMAENEPENGLPSVLRAFGLAE
jgi:hypothetical protein